MRSYKYGILIFVNTHIIKIKNITNIYSEMENTKLNIPIFIFSLLKYKNTNTNKKYISDNATL